MTPQEQATAILTSFLNSSGYTRKEFKELCREEKDFALSVVEKYNGGSEEKEMLSAVVENMSKAPAPSVPLALVEPVVNAKAVTPETNGNAPRARQDAPPAVSIPERELKPVAAVVKARARFIPSGGADIREIQKAFAGFQQTAMNETIAVNVRRLTSGKEAAKHFILTGKPGTGKTTAVKAIGNFLSDYGFTFYSPSPASFSDCDLRKFLIDNCEDSESRFLIFLDEVHGLPQETQRLLQLATNGYVKDLPIEIKHGPKAGRGIFRVTVDPRRHWFLCASNEEEKLKSNEALYGPNGRFKRLEFTGLQDEAAKVKMINFQLADIGAPEVLQKLPDNAIKALASRCLPNPRAIGQIISEVSVKAELTTSIDFHTGKGMRELAAEAGYFKDGWHEMHVALLMTIGADKKGVNVTKLEKAYRDNKWIMHIRLSDLENYDYITKASTGQCLMTKEGKEFLVSLEGKAKTPKA